MKIVPEEFGKLVFNENAMRKALAKDVFEKLEQTIKNGESLDSSLANSVAEAMKDWAIANGATHYSHWFQPLTGITAEKHESFLTTVSSGSPILELSGKELIKGEPDASSFPSGGLRSTFEARGYTAWDPTSFAFIKGNTLCIPTAFCSYGGHALDKKTPLLRSIDALNKEALRLFKALKMNDVKHIVTNVGPEQEYFLVDKGVFEKRLDLILTGRTLFGAPSPRGQELDDHYFGVIKPRVASFMEEVDRELWKLGISAKTEHNEVAPSQHELATIYTTCNLACDQNQLVMEMMTKIADKHHFVILFHEKPFEGVNGSGKHNNWSISTDTGINLLSPGDTPFKNQIFLLFLAAVIKAVDDYQDLLRISVASASNDHRLGKNEAPPAIISIFLGDDLTGVLKAIANDDTDYESHKEMILLGSEVLPSLVKDNTDRNRTSPFAYTGNKFEFRMPGSNKGVSDANTILNTAVAESLRTFAELLEKSDDIDKTIHSIVKYTIKEHQKILFSGNGYNDAWVEEAAKRGLCNFPTTPDALVHMTDEKNIKLFEEHHVLTSEELKARQEIDYENYVKTLEIEVKTMIHIANRDIMPAINKYIGKLAKNIETVSAIDSSISSSYQKKTLKKLSENLAKIDEFTSELEAKYFEANKISDIEKQAFFIKDTLLPLMASLRKVIDESETMMPKNYWPMPTYEELLFSEQ
ncbi:MAG: glutamine synthetase III [Bacilli bacterium]|nr:glutamine synthetase III [Bacilli bacterium]